MTTVRKNYSIDYPVAQELDNSVPDGKKSSFVTEAIKDKLQVSDLGDDELVNRKRKLQDKLEELEEEKGDLQKEINQVEQELSAIQSALEKRDEEEELIDDALPILVQEFEEKRRTQTIENPERSLKAGQKFNMWLERLDMDQEELFNQILEEVEA